MQDLLDLEPSFLEVFDKFRGEHDAMSRPQFKALAADWKKG